MPTYAYKCAGMTCRRYFERVLPMSQSDVPQDCSECGGPTVKQLFPNYGTVQANYIPYACPVTGKMINGRKAHEENLKQTGCRVLETGEKEEKARERARDEAAFDRSIDSTVDEFFATAPPAKLERLERELTGGITAEVIRQ